MTVRNHFLHQPFTVPVTIGPQGTSHKARGFNWPVSVKRQHAAMWIIHNFALLDCWIQMSKTEKRFFQEQSEVPNKSVGIFILYFMHLLVSCLRNHLSISTKVFYITEVAPRNNCWILVFGALFSSTPGKAWWAPSNWAVVLTLIMSTTTS